MGFLQRTSMNTPVRFLEAKALAFLFFLCGLALCGLRAAAPTMEELGELFLPATLGGPKLSPQGTHLAFLARMKSDWKMKAKGIGVDEKTSVCIDEKGIAKVFGSQAAYFIMADSKKPEVCKEGQKLTWNRKKKAVNVCKIMATASGSGMFDLNRWKPLTEVTPGYWYAQDGIEIEN